MTAAETQTETPQVSCDAHGETRATFACRHLCDGVACGYHSDAVTADNPWPDAWCDACDEILTAAGGVWPDDQPDIKVLCTQCHDDARERNAAMPTPVRGAGARMTEDEVAALGALAAAATQALQAASLTQWAWHELPRWQFDPDTSTLTFSDHARPRITADVRIVGCYTAATRMFEWAWHTFEDDDADAADAALLRTFGEVRGIDALTTPAWECEEATGWEMTALAALLLGAEAVYRAPINDALWYLLLSNLRRAS